MKNSASVKSETFWEHLDELRSSLIKLALATIFFAVIAFLFKDQLFAIILAPKSDDFITYRLFNAIGNQISSLYVSEPFSVKLINTQLAEQFIIHIKMSFYAAFIIVCPYALYLLIRFISPALYTNEKRYVFRVVNSGYVMFILGVLLSYFLIFPLTFRFLGTYQISSEIENQIVISSYIETMMMLNLMMGIVFEIPILCWLFAKLGFISASFMRHYRRHAIVILLIIAAVITPTSDVFTLLLVTMPMYILYEISILLVVRTTK